MIDPDQIVEIKPEHKTELIRMLGLPTLAERRAALLAHLDEAEQAADAIEDSAAVASLELLLGQASTSH